MKTNCLQAYSMFHSNVSESEVLPRGHTLNRQGLNTTSVVLIYPSFLSFVYALSLPPHILSISEYDGFIWLYFLDTHTEGKVWCLGVVDVCCMGNKWSDLCLPQTILIITICQEQQRPQYAGEEGDVENTH
jgi:hypothetical protein